MNLCVWRAQTVAHWTIQIHIRISSAYKFANTQSQRFVVSTSCILANSSDGLKMNVKVITKSIRPAPSMIQCVLRENHHRRHRSGFIVRLYLSAHHIRDCLLQMGLGTLRRALRKSSSSSSSKWKVKRSVRKWQWKHKFYYFASIRIRLLP